MKIKHNPKDEGVKIVGGKRADVMYLLQMDCNKCGHIYYMDVSRRDWNGAWFGHLACPDCGTKDIKDKDPSFIHAYNLDCTPYEIVEKEDG